MEVSTLHRCAARKLERYGSGTPSHAANKGSKPHTEIPQLRKTEKGRGTCVVLGGRKQWRFDPPWKNKSQQARQRAISFFQH